MHRLLSSILPSRVLWIALLSIAAASALPALTPGPTEVRECPHCKAKLEKRTIASGNSFGSKAWTDGKVHLPMLPSSSGLVKCPGCKKVVWMDEAKLLGTFDFSQPPSAKLKGHLPPQEVSEGDLLQLLKTEKLTRKKELHVRRTAWWLSNDSHRGEAPREVVRSADQRLNMEALIPLLDEKQPEQRIMKAELHRQLGSFGRCQELLEFPFASQMQSAARYIAELAGKKDSRLHPLP